MSKLYTLALLILNFKAVNVSDRENTYYKLCSPFNALLILPESNWEASVIHQRRFIIRLIEGFPNGTRIYMRIVGDEEKKYEFVKDGQNLDDVGTINQLIVNSPNNMIKYKAVSNWISTSLDKNKSPKSAEKIFFIVNDQTEVDDVKKVLEVIKNKDRYVVLYGEHSIGDDWTWLTLDEKNIYVLGKSIMDIESTVELVKTQSCLGDLKRPELPADTQQNVNYISYNGDHSTVNTILIVSVVIVLAIIFLVKKYFKKLLSHWRQSGVPESSKPLIKVGNGYEENQGEYKPQNPVGNGYQENQGEYKPQNPVQVEDDQGEVDTHQNLVEDDQGEEDRHQNLVQVEDDQEEEDRHQNLMQPEENNQRVISLQPPNLVSNTSKG